MLAVLGLGGGEIVLILITLIVFPLTLAAAVGLVIWLVRRNGQTKTPPLSLAAPTKRLCPQCGKEMTGDSPQGLCPACLMKVGLGTETVNPGEPKREPTAALAPAEVAKNFPHLEILELLGQGGMGMVYKVRQPQLDRFVALKILSPQLSRDPAFAERFNREAKALARLNHPNIVGVFDFGKAGEFYYFLMEFVDGVNLSQMEQAKKHLAPEEALAIVPKICDALQYAHDEGVVHRDIKPGNILVDRRGRVKIADFGLAKLAGKEREDFSITQSRMTLGTPQYMAPEQFEDPQKVDHRADIYSLGVVFYEMLTGELPMGRFAPPSQRVQMDVRFDEIVLKSLEKEPGRRYQHASEIKTDVETIAATRSSSAPPAPTPQEPADLAGARRQVKGPAIGLLITGILNWVVIPFLFLLKLWIAVKLSPQGDLVPFYFTAIVVAIPLLALVLSTYVIYAAMKMMQLERRGAAIGASVLAMLVAPGNLIGLPFGIWALVVLNRREVREAFGKKQAKPLPPLPPDMPAVNCPLPMVMWLALMDAGDYARSWETAAPYFQRSISKEEWVARLEKVRRPLGEVLSRKMVSVTQTVVGTRYEAKYESSFNGLLAATETVTYAKQPSGEWQPIGYLIRPAEEPAGAVLPRVAWGLAGLAGVLGIAALLITMFAAVPSPPELLVWSILVAALLGIVLGVFSRRTSRGRQAIAIGAVNIVIWLAILAAVNLIHRPPPTVYANQMIIRVGAGGDSAKLEGVADAHARIAFYAGDPTNGWNCEFPESAPFTATIERTIEGIHCRVVTAFGQTLLNVTGWSKFGTGAVTQGYLAFRADRPPTTQPDGSCNVIVGWWTPDDGVSIPIGVTLTKPKPDSADTAASPAAPTFGPVIERRVTDEEMKSGIGVDLESGAVVTPPKLSLTAAVDQLRSMKADIYFAPGSREWRALDMTAISWDQPSLDLSVEELTRIHWKPFRGSTRIEGFPSCYFQTREGSLGILQIVDPTEPPRGAKIRYKLVQSSPSGTNDSAPLKPIPPEAVALWSGIKKYTESFSNAHDMHDTNVMKEFQKEITARTKEIKTLLRGTVAEPLANQQDEQIRALRSAQEAHDDAAIRQAADKVKAIGNEIEKMFEQAANNSTSAQSQSEPPAQRPVAKTKLRQEIEQHLRAANFEWDSYKVLWPGADQEEGLQYHFKGLRKLEVIAGTNAPTPVEGYLVATEQIAGRRAGQHIWRVRGRGDLAAIQFTVDASPDAEVK